jgi:uncharacterized membrane protein
VRDLIRRYADQLRSSFWFLPVLLMLAAMALAATTLALDARHEFAWGGLLYNGAPGGARLLLSTIAGSMVTVGATVFSVTMVALTLASSQFGPRMIANFIRDRGNQVTIGMFIAVFVYSLLVLRRVTDDADVVPDLAVSVALLLAIVALVILIFFIHHIATSIQVMSLVEVLAKDLLAGVDSLFPHIRGSSVASAAGGAPDTRGPGQAVPAQSSGHVQLVALDALVKTADEQDLLIRLETRPGRFVVEGTPVARVWRRDGTEADVAEETTDRVGAAVTTGHRRSVVQDVEFPFRQLVEVAIRALSPGINDPITATACVHELSVALCRVAERPMPPRVLADQDGVPRLVVAQPISFNRLVGVAFDQIRQAASGHVIVYLHLLEALTTIAGCTQDPGRRATLMRQGELVVERAGQAVNQQVDLEVVRQRYAALLDTAGSRD